MVTFFDADAIAAGTTADRGTLVILALLTLAGVFVQGIFAWLIKRTADSVPSGGSAPNDGKLLAMMMTMQHQIGDLSQAMFEVRDDVGDLKVDASAMKVEVRSLHARLVDQPAWDGKTDRRRNNPPAYDGPERRKGT